MHKIAKFFVFLFIGQLLIGCSPQISKTLTPEEARKRATEPFWGKRGDTYVLSNNKPAPLNLKSYGQDSHTGDWLYDYIAVGSNGATFETTLTYNSLSGAGEFDGCHFTRSLHSREREQTFVDCNQVLIFDIEPEEVKCPVIKPQIPVGGPYAVVHYSNDQDYNDLLEVRWNHIDTLVLVLGVEGKECSEFKVPMVTREGTNSSTPQAALDQKEMVMYVENSLQYGFSMTPRLAVDFSTKSGHNFAIGSMARNGTESKIPETKVVWGKVLIPQE